MPLSASLTDLHTYPASSATSPNRGWKRFGSDGWGLMAKKHDNDSVSPIFDKEKEQQRLQEAQLIGEIGVQVGDIARTKGQIIATRDAQDKMKNVSPDQLKTAEADWRKANPGKTLTADDISGQAYQTSYNQAFNDSGFGTGGKVQQAIQAATAAVQGLAGGDLAKAVAGGSAPYIANIIGNSGLDDAGKVLAHAAVNAALAADQGKNALVGAAGAAAAKMVGMIALNAYGKPVSELSETEKQTVSALATLAAGLAGGLIGDSTADTVAAAQAGKTTVENNALSLPMGLMNYGQAVASWDQYAQANNLTPEQKQAGLNKLAKGDMPEGANIPKVIVDAYKDGVLAAGAAYLGLAATAAKVTTGALLGAIANGTYQWFDMSQPGNENKSYDYLGTGAAAITGGLAPGRDVWQNVGIAAGGAVFTDGPNAGSVSGAVAGGLIGGAVGKYAPDLLDPVFGSSAGFWSDVGSAYISEATGSAVKDAINKQEKNK